MRSNFGHIEKISDRKYRVYWPENHRQRSKTIDGSLDDAETFLARKKIDRSGIVSTSTTYAEYWQLAVVPTFAGLAETTIADYERLWRVELQPRIGTHKVSDTTWRYVQHVLNEIDSASVAQHAYRLWKKMCNLAIRDGLLVTNPVDRNIRLPEHKRKEKVTLTGDEVLALLEAAKDSKYLPIVCMEIGGGLRHEEACAITRSDIRFEGRWAILSVSKALTTAQGKVIRKDTKTAFSERLVALGEPFCGILKANMGKIPANVESQSNPSTISHNWRDWCKRHGVTYIPFGQMRTQFSVMHQQAGSIDSLVSLAMGHSDGTTRGRNYTVNTLPAMELLADNLTAYLQNPPRKVKKVQVRRKSALDL